MMDSGCRKFLSMFYPLKWEHCPYSVARWQIEGSLIPPSWDTWRCEHIHMLDNVQIFWNWVFQAPAFCFTVLTRRRCWWRQCTPRPWSRGSWSWTIGSSAWWRSRLWFWICNSWCWSSPSSAALPHTSTRSIRGLTHSWCLHSVAVKLLFFFFF